MTLTLTSKSDDILFSLFGVVLIEDDAATAASDDDDSDDDDWYRVFTSCNTDSSVTPLSLLMTLSTLTCTLTFLEQCPPCALPCVKSSWYTLGSRLDVRA